MRRALVMVGGVLNALFVLFHIWMGWRLHVGPAVPEGWRPLLETFNDVGAFELVFFAVVSLAWPAELLATKIGRAVVVLIVATYVGRALCEFVIYPQATPMIVGTCLVLAGVYAAAWLLPERTPARA